MHGRGCIAAGCAWQGGVWQEKQSLQWVVCILLECILVEKYVLFYSILSVFYTCHGMTESVKIIELVKFLRKDQSFEDFSSKCLFSLFGQIPCIFLVFLIEICSFCKNIIRFPFRIA